MPKKFEIMQLQYRRVAGMLKVPEVVATSRDLADLDRERQQANHFNCWLQHEAGIAPAAAGRNQRPAMEDLVHNFKVIRLISSALDRALQLLLPQLQKQQRKPAAAKVLKGAALTAGTIHQSLNIFIEAWANSSSEDGAAADRLQVALQVVPTGLLATIEQASRCVTTRLQAAVQQQRQPVSSSGSRKAGSSSSCSLLSTLQDQTVCSITCGCLCTFRFLFAVWPGATPLTAAALRPCFQPVVELAWAVLEAGAAAGCFAGSSSVDVWDDEIAAALDLANLLSQKLGRAWSVDPKLSLWQPHVQQLASDAVGKLLLLMAGMTVGMFYEEQQQQQPPGVKPYHQQLLEALGVQPLASLTHREHDMWLYSTVMSCTGAVSVLDMQFRAAAASSSSGPSDGCSVGRGGDGRACSASPLTAATVAAAEDVGFSSRLVELLLLTVLEYAVLAAAAADYASLTAAMVLCLDVSAHMHQLGTGCAAAGSTAGRLEAAADLTDLLLQPLLLELGPAVMHAAGAAAAADSAAAQSPAAALVAADVRSNTGEALMKYLNRLTYHTIRSVTASDVLCPVIRQHPAETATLLEAAVRSAVARCQSATLHQSHSRPAELTEMAQVAHFISTQAAQVAHLIMTEEGRPVDVAAGQQLFALAVTVLKAAQTLCCSSGAGRGCGRRIVSWALAVNVSAATPDQLPARMRLLLLSRMLAVVGQMLSSVSSNTAWADQQACEGAGIILLSSICRAMGPCAVLLCSEVELPGQAAAAAEAAQQLQQQATSLYHCLLAQRHRLRQASAAPDTAAEVADSAAAGAAHQAAADGLQGWTTTMREEMQQAFPNDLAQQLQQFGEAVCHQLPVSLWCCNPRCTNLQMHSELELVGGKSCVCSGCHTARFCSRECLEQCWKRQLHKGVCKRIVAGRQQQ